MEDRRIRRIAIAGATGFVGSALATRLARQDVVYALGRRATAESPEAELDDTPRVVPRRCDLFSVGETARALEGAEVAVYLVHSMSPNARL
ncbi:MAG TPA: NAD(P)H-binding protein, partial [Myxococcota bacterium]|nr:NAD(P)H-binding protein [Myxococcota bacterium]